MPFRSTFALALTSAFLIAANGPALPHVAQRISGPDGGWDLLNVDPGSGKLFVARSGGVMAVDIASGKVTPEVVAGNRLHTVVPVPGMHLALATAGGTNSAILFDTGTGQVKTEIKVGAKPDAAIYEPASRTVWVMNAGDGSISVVDPAAAKVVATVPVGGSLELPALDGKGHLFVNVEDKNELVEVDLAKHAVMKHLPLAGCDGPTGLAYAPDGLLFSACANGVAKVTRASDGKAGADIAVGPRPDGAAFDPVHKRVLIPSGGDGTLTVIDASTAVPHKIGTVPTEKGARTIAVDPRTGTAYLPAAKYAAAQPGERPKAVPGSFEILVVR